MSSKNLSDGSAFDEHRNAMTLLNFPDMRPAEPFKDRLAILEETAQTQARMNQLTYETFGDSKKDLHATEENLKALLASISEQFSNELAALRREYEHRFELQNAENRRLQASFALLKAESTQSNKRLVCYSLTFSFFSGRIFISMFVFINFIFDSLSLPF
jgi:hypothetical protein